MDKKIKIVFTGGGTGGHLMPLISVIREIKKLSNPNTITLYYLGPKDKNAFELLSKEGVIIYSILAGKIRRYFSFKNIIDIFFTIPLGFLQSFFILLFINPKLIFSKAGGGSSVVCLSAKIINIPIFLHESDSVLGLSNRLASSFAKKIFTSFEITEGVNTSKAIFVGNPIRQELLNGNKEEARTLFNITSSKPVILISGGSQGAESINDFIVSILNDLLHYYEVIHISGVKNYQKTKTESNSIFILNPELKANYHLYDSLNEVQLKNAYAVANLVVSRAGAGNIFEISAIGKPSILIPLPTSASNHQLKNAYQHSDSGASMTLEQANLTHHFFMGQIDYLLSKSEKMSASALQFAKPKAGEKIAQEILEFLKVT